jgi:hypothetical protein
MEHIRIHSGILGPDLLIEIERPVGERVPVATLITPKEGVISSRCVIDAIVSTVPDLLEEETQILGCESNVASVVGP